MEEAIRSCGKLRRAVLKTALRCLVVLLVLAPSWVAAQNLPKPDHIVIVFQENQPLKRVDRFITRHPNSYLARLKQQGTSFDKFYARLHPSQPNYIEFFAGDVHGVMDNELHDINKPSLGGELIKSGRTFTGYAEDLPYSGFKGKRSGYFVRKHAPWISFTDVPDSSSQPLSQFPKDAAGFAKLPTLSMVIPNLKNDMHGTTRQVVWQILIWGLFKKSPLIKNGDLWLKNNLQAYAEWAMTNNSLLIVTWDEGDPQECDNCTTVPPANQIATIIVGQGVKPGYVSPHVYKHEDLLRTLEKMYDLPLLGRSKNAKVIDDIWESAK